MAYPNLSGAIEGFFTVHYRRLSERFRVLSQRAASIYDWCQLSGLEKLLKQVLHLWFGSSLGQGNQILVRLGEQPSQSSLAPTLPSTIK